MDFLGLFQHGIWQIDCWTEDSLAYPAPRTPEMPRHPRHARPLPPAPNRWEFMRLGLSESQRVLLDDCVANGLLDDLVRPCWSPRGDPDCLDGWILLAELLPEWLDKRGTPRWWLADEYDRATADGLHGALCHVEAALEEARRAHLEAVRAIQAAPETDPAWAAFDAACADHPARLEAHRVDREERARASTGFANQVEAEAAYWATHTYTGAHALMGYRPPERVLAFRDARERAGITLEAPHVG